MTSIQKEIINSTTNFFYFLKDDNIIFILDLIYDSINKNSIKIKIDFIEDKEFYISIMLLKSFLNSSTMYSSTIGEYNNSDKLLDYCVNLYCYYCIYNDIEFHNKRKTRGQFYLLFYLLLREEIIEEKKIKKNKFFIKYWRLNYDEKIKIKINYKNFNYSYTPFSIKKQKEETYLIGVSFWNVYNIYSKNFYSNTKFNINKEEYLDLLIKRYVHVDIEYLNEIKKNIQKNDDNIESLNYEIKRIFNNENWDIDNEKSLKTIQRKYSKKIEDNIVTSFLNTKHNEKDKIYFPFYFDFRGRKYYYSPIGPTQSSILRLVYHYGWYDIDEFSNIVKIERIFFFKKIIQNFCENNLYEYDDIFLESYFWVLIEIGKIDIVKSDIEVKDETIIEIGINIVNSYIKNTNFINKYNLEEKLVILRCILIFKSLRKNYSKSIKKRVLEKDGTASVYQVSMILLKPKSQDSLKMVNLYNENAWIDTYSYIIKNFIEDKKIKKDYIKLFNRKNTKKVLMTIPYSIGIKSAYEYFKETLDEQKIEYTKNKDLEKTFKLFYQYVKNDVELKYFYDSSTKKYLNNIMDNFLSVRTIKIETKTGETDLSYKKMNRKIIDLFFEMKVNNEITKKRITKLILIPSNSIDYKQTNISLGANLRHFYEADLLRSTEISLNYSIHSIHDAELIDFNSCSKLVLLKNRIFQDLLPEFIINSNFIIL